MSVYPNTVIYYPACIVQGYTGNPGSGGTIASNTSGQAAWGPYKACTCYMLTFNVQGAGTAGTLKVNLYGAPSAGNGNASSTTITVNVPATGPFVAYSLPQNYPLTFGGYLQIALYGTITVNFNGILWVKQIGI